MHRYKFRFRKLNPNMYMKNLSESIRNLSYIGSYIGSTSTCVNSIINLKWIFAQHSIMVSNFQIILTDNIFAVQDLPGMTYVVY